MTKLESKLLELGYDKTTYFDIPDIRWWKGSIAVATDKKCLEILKANVQVGCVDNQNQINKLQEAYYILQKDLEVLKEYDNK